MQNRPNVQGVNHTLKVSPPHPIYCIVRAYYKSVVSKLCVFGYAALALYEVRLRVCASLVVLTWYALPSGVHYLNLTSVSCENLSFSKQWPSSSTPNPPSPSPPTHTLTKYITLASTEKRKPNKFRIKPKQNIVWSLKDGEKDHVVDLMHIGSNNNVCLFVI